MANDLTQTAWLRTLEYLQREGKQLPPAATEEELKANYAEYEGLYVQHVGWESKRQSRPMEPLTDVEDQGEAEEVEAAAVIHDLLNDPTTRDAIRAFIQAWKLQERGITIPRKLRRDLVRYREVTGLALELRKGRTSG